jgi:hypothetical protein
MNTVWVTLKFVSSGSYNAILNHGSTNSQLKIVNCNNQILEGQLAGTKFHHKPHIKLAARRVNQINHSIHFPHQQLQHKQAKNTPTNHHHTALSFQARTKKKKPLQ